MRSPITSHEFVSKMTLDEERFTAHSEVSAKLVFLASRPDLWTFLASPALMFMAWKFSGGPKYSPEFLYVVAVWGLIQSTYRITRRLFILDASQDYEMARGDFDRLFSDEQAPAGNSGLYYGWVRVFVRPIPPLKAPTKVLPQGRCVYLLEDNKIIRVLARSQSDAFDESVAQLADLGLQVREDDEERFVIMP